MSAQLVPCASAYGCSVLVQRKLRGGRARICEGCRRRRDLENDRRYRRRLRDRLRRERRPVPVRQESAHVIERTYREALAAVKGTYTLDPWSRTGSGTEEHAISRALRSTRGRGAA